MLGYIFYTAYEQGHALIFDSFGAFEESSVPTNPNQTIDGTQPYFAWAAWAMRNHDKGEAETPIPEPSSWTLKNDVLPWFAQYVLLFLCGIWRV